jgi:hypothetical protein
MSDSTPGIMDLSDKGPDCREWQALERYVREYARQTVREIMASESAPSAPPQDTGKGNLKTQRERERERELIRQGLERYRTEPPDSNIRKGIDWLLQKHAAIQRCFSGSELENFKKRHNAVVLQYIIARPMNRNQIGKRLKTNIYIPDNVIEQGISELAQILFGYWD